MATLVNKDEWEDSEESEWWDWYHSCLKTCLTVILGEYFNAHNNLSMALKAEFKISIVKYLFSFSNVRLAEPGINDHMTVWREKQEEMDAN